MSFRFLLGSNFDVHENLRVLSVKLRRLLLLLRDLRLLLIVNAFLEELLESLLLGLVGFAPLLLHLLQLIPQPLIARVEFDCGFEVVNCLIKVVKFGVGLCAEEVGLHIRFVYVQGLGAVDESLFGVAALVAHESQIHENGLLQVLQLFIVVLHGV